LFATMTDPSSVPIKNLVGFQLLCIELPQLQCYIQELLRQSAFLFLPTLPKCLESQLAHQRISECPTKGPDHQWMS
jgi:hypothetical protein